MTGLHWKLKYSKQKQYLFVNITIMVLGLLGANKM